MHLADWYKLASKSLFLLQLLLSWMVVFLSTLAVNSSTGGVNTTSLSGSESADPLFGADNGLYYKLAFILSAVISVFISVDGMFKCAICTI